MSKTWEINAGKIELFAGVINDGKYGECEFIYEEVEIMPCPFCKMDEHLEIRFDFRYKGHDHRFIFCRNCKARGPLSQRDIDAVINWNYSHYI
jgi:hypothetical protein